MYYLGLMPNADKRLYCTTQRGAFNSFAEGISDTKLLGQREINLPNCLGLYSKYVFLSHAHKISNLCLFLSSRSVHLGCFKARFKLLQKKCWTEVGIIDTIYVLSHGPK